MHRSLTHDTKKKSDKALMRAVVLEVMPSAKAKLDANKKSLGYLKAMYESAIELHDKRDAQEREFDGLGENVDRGDADKARPLLMAVINAKKSSMPADFRKFNKREAREALAKLD